MEAIRKIFGEIGFKNKGSKDLDKLNKNMDSAKESMIDMTTIGGAAVVAMFTALAHASFKAGVELETQVVRLQALSGDAYPKLEESMNAAIAASDGLTATGDMSTALNSALKMGASIDVLTGSMTELQQLSEITGDDLSMVMRNMSRSIATGSTRFLEQNPILAKNIEGFKNLGAGYDEATKKKRELFIVDALQKNQLKIQEQYNKIVNTTAGQLKIVSTQWGNVKETIGGLIMRGLAPLISILGRLLRFLGETERGIAIVETAFIALSIVVGTLMVIAFKKMAVAGFIALLPFLKIIAIGALVVAIVTAIVLIFEDLWVGFHGGQSVIFEFWNSFMELIGEAWDWIVDFSKAILKALLLPFEIAWKGIKNFFRMVKSIFMTILRFYAMVGMKIARFLFPVDIIVSLFNQFISFMKAIPDKIIALFRKIRDSVTDLFKDVGQKTAGVLSSFTFSSEQVKARAEGGPISAGQPYLVGEQGPELIVPGSNGNVIPNHKIGGGTRVSMKSLVGNIVINVSSAAEGAEEIKNVILDALDDLSQNVFAAEMGIEIS